MKREEILSLAWETAGNPEFWDDDDIVEFAETVALRAALAEQEDAEHGKCRHQWMRVGLDPYASARCINCGTFKDVRPSRREWVGLTDEEIDKLFGKANTSMYLAERLRKRDLEIYSFGARDAEAALKEKNYE